MSSIVALSTAAGYSALAIVRLSGPLSREVFPDLEVRKASLRSYRGLDGALIDEVVAVFYAGKASYTGEDSLELTCHGNPLIVKKIIDDLLSRGFEGAAAGEFTRRAFTHGKLDLTQAEAVAEVIAARSDRALAAAHRVLAGDLGTAIKGFADRLLTLVALVEAYIDFPEEGLPPQGPVGEEVAKLIAELGRLKATQNAHRLTHEGARVAIVGAPNAGKSSLFNALLSHDRALVSPEAGTTRDYIEAPLTLDGNALLLIDTAGLNETPGTVEKLGIARTRDQLATSDIILWVVDGTLPMPPAPDGLDIGRTILVRNKADLAGFNLKAADSNGLTSINVSASARTGLDELKKALLKQLSEALPASDTLLVSDRHAAALAQAMEELVAAQELVSSNGAAELLAHHLHQALEHLGEILGKFDNEQILDKLFSKFCIGK